MNVTVNIEGMQEFRTLLKNLPKKAEKGANVALKLSALDLMAKAQELAPIDTGDLRGSAYAVVGGSGEIGGATQEDWLTEDQNPDSQRSAIPDLPNHTL